MKPSVISGLILSCAMLFLVTTGHAQNAMPPLQSAMPAASLSPANTTLFNTQGSGPAVGNIPALSSLVSQGARLFYMGERSGMPGWFIFMNGQVQMIYLSPDKQTAFMGAMFSNQGDNITAEQVKYLSQNNKEFIELMNTVTAQQNTGLVSPLGQPETTPVAAPQLPLLSNNLPAIPVTPGEKLYQDLLNAHGVMVGSNPKAEILMVIDTNCPHCQSTWKDMRDLVRANRVQIRLIPVTNLDVSGEDIRTGAKLLESANPFEAWNAYVDGNKEALAGKPNPDNSKAVLANRDLIDRWKIKSTPYLVYRAKDGKVKLVSGKPDDINAVLKDLGA